MRYTDILHQIQEQLTTPSEEGTMEVSEELKNSTDTADDTEAGSKPGLWENIRKKKEREGKKYRPAKPGDKDRPDPESYKKAQK